MTYTVRSCRGHWHVCIQGLGDVDNGQAYPSKEVAQKRADILNKEIETERNAVAAAEKEAGA